MVPIRWKRRQVRQVAGGAHPGWTVGSVRMEGELGLESSKSEGTAEKLPSEDDGGEHPIRRLGGGSVANPKRSKMKFTQ